MEIEAAEMTGDVDDFPDEEQAGDETRLHGFAGEFASIDAACCDFGFFVTFRGCRIDAPTVQLPFQILEAGIGVIRWGVEFEPARGEATGKKFLKGLAGSAEVSAGRSTERGGGVARGYEIEMDGLALLPVGRDLEDGRAAEASMREEHFFAERMFSGGSNNLRGNAREFGITPMIGTVENQRNEGGARGDDFVAELAGEVVAEGSGAHLGDGEASCGNNENRRTELRGIGAEKKFGGVADFGDARVEKNLNAGDLAFGCEQVGDIGGGAIAEELAERFFVVGNVVLFDEREKIAGRVASQGGLGEMGVRGKEVFWVGVEVGEIAAASAGDEDFLSDAVCMFEDSDAASAFACFESTEQPGGAGTQDQNVEGTEQRGLTEIGFGDAGVG